MIDPPSKILIETNAGCNRQCATCLRSNDPTKARRKKYMLGWKTLGDELPSETVYKIINQAVKFGFKVPIGFVWFNEPLLDKRLPTFIRFTKDKGFYVYTTTNGDLLTDTLAFEFDGVLDHLEISIYGLEGQPDKVTEKANYFRSLFNKTKLSFTWGSDKGHVTTHFSPKPTLKEAIKKFNESKCFNPQNRLIIAYNGEMALCCEDINFNWDLGNINDSTLKELWYGPHHQKILEILNTPSGRHAYKFCEICPHTGAFC